MPSSPILVIEDDEAILDTIEDVLAWAGYAVLKAEHGAHALDIIGHQRVALILLDMKMPVMDGWAFARAYHETTQPHVPIVVLTAARDAARWASQIDATAFLAKPFEVQDLLTLVARHAVL